jgi:hypothetical protein
MVVVRVKAAARRPINIPKSEFSDATTGSGIGKDNRYENEN